MSPSSPPILTFTHSGPSTLRFELRINERYTLVGSYLNGILQAITLLKNGLPVSAKEQ